MPNRIMRTDNWVRVERVFTRDSHWLVHEDHWWYDEYYFAHKIDRSYKGKDPDEGMPELYISNFEFEQLKSIFDVLEKCKWGSW
jgi:hypothetical protein